jgi:5'-3' exonuclease
LILTLRLYFINLNGTKMENNTKKKSLVIFDGDGSIFRSAWEVRDMRNIAGNMMAKKRLDAEIQTILERISPDQFVGFFGVPGTKCFRYDVATIKPYKDSRNKRNEPWMDYFKPILKKHLAEEWKFYGLSHLESDDACVIAYIDYYKTHNITLIYEDWDLEQIANLSGENLKGYNPQKKKFTTITPLQGRHTFWFQMLHGCNGDSVPGIQGCGEKGAEEILARRADDSNEAYFHVVQEAYIAKYGMAFELFMTENMMLLQMLRKPAFDYPTNIQLQDFKKEEQRLKKIIDL